MEKIVTDSGDSKPLQTPMRRVFGNLWLLVRGRGAAAVMALGATALMARALGPTEFGLVVLIQAYSLLLRGLLNFQLFEAIVRYGVPAHDSNDQRTLRRLIHVCRRVDLGACITATVVAVVVAPLAGPSMGMDQHQVSLLIAYSFVLLATGNGTAIGILRLFDRFDLLGLQMAVGPILRFIGVGFAWWLDGSLWIFVAILAFTYVTENIYLSWLGLREYRQQMAPLTPTETYRDATFGEFPGLRQFLWITYWQSNMDMVPKHIATVLTGYLLGPAEAGLLRLARELSSPLAKGAVLVRQVVYLDLTRSWHHGTGAFSHVAFRTAIYGGAFGMVFVLAAYFFGAELLSTLVGKEYVAAAAVLSLMLLAATIDLAAQSLRSAAYAIGHAGKVLRMYAISAVAYVISFIGLTTWLGLIGAGLAACIAASIPIFAMVVLIRQNLTKSQ